MELKDIAEIVQILQIILIPLITVFLSNFLIKRKERTERNLRKDREVFASLKSSFSEKIDLVSFFRDHSTGDLIHRKYISQIVALRELLRSPGFVFMDRKLENYREQLLSKLSEFIIITTENTFPHEVQADYYELRFHKESRYGDQESTEKFVGLYKEIDKIGTEIYQIYNTIASLAQKKL